MVGHEQVKPLAQKDAALFAGFAAPSGPGCIGCVKGGFGVFGGEVGHIGQLFASRGVMHIKTAGAFDPMAVDQGIGLEQSGVVEQRKGRSLHVHHGLQNSCAEHNAAPNPAMTLG